MASGQSSAVGRIGIAKLLFNWTGKPMGGERGLDDLELEREQSAMAEFNEDLGITVVIKPPRWKVIAGFLAALAGAALAVWLGLILFAALMVMAVLVAFATGDVSEFAIDDNGLLAPRRTASAKVVVSGVSAIWVCICGMRCITATGRTTRRVS